MEVPTLSPEASLRASIDDIVLVHAEPLGIEQTFEPVELGGVVIDMPTEEVRITGDTIADTCTGIIGAQILTQEVADPDLDQQLPHDIAVHVHHNLGKLVAHVTVPAYQNPGLVPSKQQKRRPSITTVVDSNLRQQFDRNFMLNEVMAHAQESSDAGLLVLFDRLVRPVTAKPSKMQAMREDQMQTLEEILNGLFWPGERQSSDSKPSFRERMAKRLFGSNVRVLNASTDTE